MASTAARRLPVIAPDTRVCVVVAAAGWGKTHAVRQLSLPTAWVRHGGSGAAPDVAAALLEALRPHLPPPRDELAAGPASERPEYAAELCHWLRAVLDRRLVLVVDDVHELPRDSGALRLLDGLCRHADGPLHLVLMSRSELPFSLARQRGQGRVAELHAPELAMDRAEIAMLARAALPGMPPALPRMVDDLSGGWPAAVRFAVDALRAASVTTATRSATGKREPVGARLVQRCRSVLAGLVSPGERLWDYLTEEVFGAEPEPARRLLRWLSVVGAVDADSATAAGVSGAPALLADLTRRGLVHRLPGPSDRWTPAPLVREYLDREQPPDGHGRAALHAAAAAEYLRRGSYGAALSHATAAGDGRTSGALLVRHGARLVNGGHGTVVLAAASVADGVHDPAVQRVVGQARQVLGQLTAADEHFRLAGGDADELAPALAWRVGTVAYRRGEFGRVLDLRGRTRLAGEDTADEARWLALLAVAGRATGDYPGSRTDAERAVAVARRAQLPTADGADPAAAAAGHGALAALAAADGDRCAAAAHHENALAAAREGDDQLQLLALRVQRAAALADLGLPREAVVEADAAVRLGRRCGDVLMVAQALTVRAGALARLGTLDSALRDLTAARDTYQRSGSRLLARPLCGLGDVYRMRGQVAMARAAYERALELAEPHHDVLGLGSALVGLARVRAADDPATAHRLAERAVQLGEGTRRIPALLARGWVAATAGDRVAAGADAARAGAVARQRHDDPGLAEALVLAALCSADPAQRDRAVGEAVHIWREAGCRPEEAAALMVASRLGVPATDLGAAFAMETLRALEVDLRAPRPAGPLAVLARSAPSASIRALGVFQVSHNGVPLPRTAWQSRKARQLLKIIVARRRPVPREQLMELLWPEVDTARTANRLSVLLSALRDILQPGGDQADAGPLVTDGTGVWLDLTAIEVDVERFLQQADGALDAHRLRADDALVRLVAAEAAYTGGFLEDDPYQEWAAPLAQEVQATHSALLRALVYRLARLGELDDMARYTLRLLDKDGYDERVHLDYVAALHAAGRHGEARRRYQVYERAMAEIGVVPKPFVAGHRDRVRHRPVS